MPYHVFKLYVNKITSIQVQSLHVLLFLKFLDWRHQHKQSIHARSGWV
jgi:hypothetical protein